MLSAFMRQLSRYCGRTLWVWAWLWLLPAPAAAQRLVEASVGLEGTVSRFGQIEETGFGFSLRFGVDFARRVTAELALIRFPEKVGGHFGQRIWLVGGRVRVWQAERDGARLFARFRAGRVFYGGSFFERALPERRYPAFDVGATVENDLTPYFVWRIEAGDLIVPFDNVLFTEAGPPRILKTTHNLMISTGVAFRF